MAVTRRKRGCKHFVTKFLQTHSSSSLRRVHNKTHRNLLRCGAEEYTMKFKNLSLLLLLLCAMSAVAFPSGIQLSLPSLTNTDTSSTSIWSALTSALSFGTFGTSTSTSTTGLSSLFSTSSNPYTITLG
ncbi:uncharacterized protein LOC108677522 [Hyalella azteca]|uniref:Uncharacterized protein LOC108677522 n=1 Tax=Hyalella azteca TaxID=294128 RepID=A0A979FQZ9_HYAAZ|nr:uncharacterized protein LOC108677522 [Hyalella azteca]